jgi:hypothetical protein
LLTPQSYFGEEDYSAEAFLNLTHLHNHILFDHTPDSISLVRFLTPQSKNTGRESGILLHSWCILTIIKNLWECRTNNAAKIIHPQSKNFLVCPAMHKMFHIDEIILA